MFSFQVFALLLTLVLSNSPDKPKPVLPAWQPGYLDIHHINTASGNACFFVLPDGTTLLVDAGAIKAPDHDDQHFYLATNKTHSAGQIITDYIKKVHPSKDSTVLDYALITHFHEDHFGTIDTTSKTSKKGDYLLSGITEVDELMQIGTLIDRAYPNYDNPVGMLGYYDKNRTFKNYLKFVESRKVRGEKNEQLLAGSDRQIKLLHGNYPTFSVRNVKTNLSTWSGDSQNAKQRTHDFSKNLDNCDFNENSLSLALTINYGRFDYFTGGDMNGYDFRNMLDLETPIASAIEEVDAMSLNHHGYWDANNEFFMNTLRPAVVVHQSRHDPHFQFPVLNKIARIKADFYTNNLRKSVADIFSEDLKKLTKGSNGHIVIRVLPGGDQYYVYTLEDDDFSLSILNQQGPYQSR